MSTTAANVRSISIPPGTRQIDENRESEGFVVRRRMLFVGKRLFAHFGYAGTSIVDIAQAADLPAKEILRHFRSKPRLLAAIFDDAWKNINPKMADVVFATLDTNEAMLEIFPVLTRIFDEDRELAKLWLFEGHLQRDESGGILVSGATGCSRTSSGTWQSAANRTAHTGKVSNQAS